jgi:hypothetical protein
MMGRALRGKRWGRGCSGITGVDGFWRHLKSVRKFNWRRDEDWRRDLMIGGTLRRQRW